MPRTRYRRQTEYDNEPEELEQESLHPGQLSSNAHWMFGSLFAGLTLVGFAFGVWAGASKTKPVEVAEATPREAEKLTPVIPTPPKEVEKQREPEPKAKEPEPEPKKPEPEPKKVEPKAKEPEPKKPEPEPKKPEPEPKKVAVKPVAFKEIQPILNGFCGNCHGQAGKPKGGVDLRSIASIMKGGNDGEIVVAGDPKKSRLYLSIMEGSMPPDGKPAPDPKQLQLIHDWILSGAK